MTDAPFQGGVERQTKNIFEKLDLNSRFFIGYIFGWYMTLGPSMGLWVGLSLRDFRTVRPEFFINLAEFFINSPNMWGFYIMWFLTLKGKIEIPA